MDLEDKLERRHNDASGRMNTAHVPSAGSCCRITLSLTRSLPNEFAASINHDVVCIQHFVATYVVQVVFNIARH